MKSFKTLAGLLICLFLGMSISVSCIPGDLLDKIDDMENTDESDDTDGPDDPDDPDDNKTPDQEASDAIKAKYPPLYEAGYMELYDHMPSGIYEYTSDDKVLLIAKSSDGGGFFIQDVDHERATGTNSELGIPANWYATDGQRKGYFFDRSLHNYDNELGIFRDTARYAVIDEYLTREALFGMDAELAYAHSPRGVDIALASAFYPLAINNSTIFHSPSILIKEAGREKIAGYDCTVYSLLMDLSAIGMVRKYQDLYVMDNGVCAKSVSYNMETEEGSIDFILSYADLNVGDFNDVFTKIHQRHCIGTVVLPEEMYPQYTKYADEWLSSWYSIPAMAVYEGQGKIQRMSVTRTYNLKPFDNVCTIEVIIEGATYNEAVSYIAQAEEKAGINVWNENENVMMPDLEYVIYKSWFDPCHPTCPHDLGDTAVGYEYVVTYLNGLLTIIFNVTHTGHL